MFGLGCRHFLVALKQFGICQVNISSAVKPFPVHFLVDFCRDNSDLKALELQNIYFTDEVVAIRESAAYTLNLDKLGLYDIRFKTSTAATDFAHFVAQLSASAWLLGAIQDEVNCEFKMLSVEQLTLYPWCGIKHFQAALDAGMATVTRLTVELCQFNDARATTEKVESLARMIRGALKLNSLTIHNRDHKLPQLLQALEACPTVTEIHVIDYIGYPYDFTEPGLQQLRRITARNSELGQFVADPSSFPNAKLLTLMIQLNDCPSGLYMLARRLPEVLSFEKTKPDQKFRK
jgi:hypothetical protein